MMSRPSPIPASFDDWRAQAQRRLPNFLFGYVDGGSLDEQTLRDNVAAWRRVHLRQHVLRDVSACQTATRFFDVDVRIPLALAPVGLGGALRQRGEVQAARAAQEFGVPFTLCTPSICSMEEVRAATTAPFWYQLYMMRDRGIVRELLQRAQAVGCTTLVFTVDLARVGCRRADIRHGMDGGGGAAAALRRVGSVLAHPRWTWDVALRGGPLVFGNLRPYLPKATKLADFKTWVDAQFDASVTWKDIEWLRSQWNGPILLKGILEVEDAGLAADIGVQGIVVSNHGGRQLDGAVSTAEALPRIVDAIGGRGLTVLVDGGIRSGNDILRARALGADGVMVGRPWVYANAAGGQAGVARWLGQMEHELATSLGLMGVDKLADLGRQHLAD